MGLIPMQFYGLYPTICESHRRNAFKFPPPSRAELFAQTRSFPNRRTSGNPLDIAYFADDFKIHSVHYPTSDNTVNGPKTIDDFASRRASLIAGLPAIGVLVAY